MSPEQRDTGMDTKLAMIAALCMVAIVAFKCSGAIRSMLARHRLLASAVTTGVILSGYYTLKPKILARLAAQDMDADVFGPAAGKSVFAGFSKNGKRIFIPDSARRMHAQIVGTTNAGKTESVILPWAIDDMRRGRGLLIVDGKSDRTLLDKLYAYAAREHRERDVKILSLCDPNMSHTFNFMAGGSPLEVAERVFKAFTFENEYFKNLQFEALLQTLLLFESAGIKPTPMRVTDALRNPQALAERAMEIGETDSGHWAQRFLKLSASDREQRTSGLITQLQIFSVGDTASVFNSEETDIDFERALAEGHIVYCQLPALKVPTLGMATGKLVLQCFQSAVASRHLGRTQGGEFFTVYLDDFTEYLTESFVTLLNKSRSANVGVVFAHQALGDLSTLGDGVMNSILTNANLKIFMRTNEPESAEYFAKVIGTLESSKLTERQTKGVFGAKKTGDGSVRLTEEFKFHPNLFKQGLGVGEAVIVVPHENGCLPMRLKFRIEPNLDPVAYKGPKKPRPVNLEEALARALEAQTKTVLAQGPPAAAASYGRRLLKIKDLSA